MEEDLIEICLAEKLIDDPTFDPIDEEKNNTKLSAQMDTAFSSIFHSGIGTPSTIQNNSICTTQNITPLPFSNDSSPNINFNNSPCGLAQLNPNDANSKNDSPRNLFSNLKRDFTNQQQKSLIHTGDYDNQSTSHSEQLFKIGSERDIETEGFWQEESLADTPRE